MNILHVVHFEYRLLFKTHLKKYEHVLKASVNYMIINT